MPLPLAVPLIGAGTQVLNNAIDMWQNRQQRGFDKSMADYAYSKDLDMWNRANEYNSPKNQMLRFEEAGLNKNLIYSQGQPGQAAATMPKYQDVKGTFGVPGFNANQFASVVNQYQDFEIKNKQKDLLTAQIHSAEAEAEIKDIQSYLWNPYTRSQDEPMYGLPKNRKSLAEYMLDAKDLDIQTKQKHLTLQEGGIKHNELVNWWLNKKNQVYENANINIDKDSILSRYIADIFGDVIKNFAGKLKTGANYVFNKK